MKYLCVPEEYTKDGEKKVSWKRIGELFESKAGKTYAKIYHIPNTLISVFEGDKTKSKQNQDTDDFGADLTTPF